MTVICIAVIFLLDIFNCDRYSASARREFCAPIECARIYLNFFQNIYKYGMFINITVIKLDIIIKSELSLNPN